TKMRGEKLPRGVAMTFEILTIIVIINAVATIELWRRAARRPVKLKKKFLNRLWRGKPITPKHEPPPPLTVFVENRELQFLSDFENFANVINWQLADVRTAPWRLQELPTFKLSKFGPATYGRRYAVFHNQARVGEIELKPDVYYST